jgi:hypothetical protein
MNNNEVIINYYSTVDKDILNNICENNDLKNLIYLSIENDVNIFNKKHKYWQIKSKDKLLKECDNLKKKEIKQSSFNLANLAKLNNILPSKDVKNIFSKLENKINTLDNFINYVNNMKDINNINKSSKKNNYLECYSNC